MLAWIPSTPQSPHAYMPTRSSPLVPRHPTTNVVRQPLAPTTNTSHSIFNFSAMDPTPKQSSSSKVPQKRAVKPNPLLQKTAGDAGKERRRDMFLKKVATDRDARRWAGRADQIERLDHLKQQRRWQQHLEKSAPSSVEPSDADEEDEEHDEDAENRPPMHSSSSSSNQATMGGVPNVFNNYVRSSPLQTVWSQNPEAEVEAVAQQEDEELDALLAIMEEDERRANAAGGEQHYGSDDDEYDSIFSEYLAAERTSKPPQHEDYMIDDHDYDDMDMTG